MLDLSQFESFPHKMLLDVVSYKRHLELYKEVERLQENNRELTEFLQSRYRQYIYQLNRERQNTQLSQNTTCTRSTRLYLLSYKYLWLSLKDHES